MNRLRTANILIAITAALLIITGALHLSGFGSINTLAQSTNVADVKVLVPVLWLATGIDMIVMGLIVGAIGYENSTGGRLALAVVAISPIVMAVLQLIYFGFIPPTALLFLDGGMVLICAWMREPRRRRTSSGH
jgi:hypothetical protein